MMTNDELTNLKELLKKFRHQIDSDWSTQIEAAGWPDSREVYSNAKKNLDSIDTVINQVELYKSNEGIVK